MAYQPPNNYPQQQYYTQGPPPPQSRQPASYENYEYNDQYAGYGNDQGQYEQQWDNGYYEQPPQDGRGNANMNGPMSPPRQQYQGGNGPMNPQMRPQQRRQPPPRDQFGQEQMYDNAGTQRGESRGRGDFRGRGNGRPTNLPQGQPGLRPQGTRVKNLQLWAS